MTKGNEPQEQRSDRELVLSREFDAPRDLVWQAWTNPMHVVRWWGPKGFTTTIETMDVRPGGAWKHVMRGPDGTNYPNESVFSEVVWPERIVYSHAGRREGGPGVHFVATWTFESLEGNRTRLTIRQVFATAAQREQVVREFGAEEGARQTLGRLAEYLEGRRGGVDEAAGRQASEDGAEASERELVITRTFDASREQVFRAWTDPGHMAKWWGPKGFSNPECELDVRPGGVWRIVMQAQDGTRYPCQGVYRQVAPPGLLEFTNDAVDKDGTVLLKGLTRVVFEEDGLKTRMVLTTRAVANVVFARAYLAGMEAGWGQSIDRLAKVLAKGS
jgi:uncharacterized protein YndB with AHSA1/START domain